MDNYSTFEAAVQRLVTNILDEWSERLADLGLRSLLVEPRCSSHGTPETYESELEIRLYEESEIVDVLEFHVYLDGKEVGSLPDIEQWLRSNLRDVEKRRQEFLGKD